LEKEEGRKSKGLPLLPLSFPKEQVCFLFFPPFPFSLFPFPFFPLRGKREGVPSERKKNYLRGKGEEQ